MNSISTGCDWPGHPSAPPGLEIAEAGGELSSVLSLPLASGGRVIAALSVGCPVGDELDRQLLADLAQRAGSALDNALTYAGQQRVGNELQRSLMPAEPPYVPGLQLAARYLPSAVGALAGGDFHQVIERDDDVVLVLGDVEGHGMTSAARMGQLRAAVAALALQGHQPGSLLPLLAKDTDQILTISLATLLVASFNPTTRMLTVASAGHPPPLLVRPEGTTYLDVDPGPPLGAGRATFPESVLVLRPGSRILLFSDGLVERRGESLTDGLERLRGAVEHARRSTEDLEEMVDLVLSGAGCDDGADENIAILVLCA